MVDLHRLTLTNSGLTLIFVVLHEEIEALYFQHVTMSQKILNNKQNEFCFISGRLKLLNTLDIQNFHLSFLTSNCLYSFMV